VHLVTGRTGAGKTWHARAIAERFRALRFSIDDWMTRLFWPDSPDPIEFEWTMARIARCEAQIRDEVIALIEIGTDSVLDLGFTKAGHRAEFAEFARSSGADVRLHWIDVPPEERWRRVQQRNSERGETYAMQVDRAMFDFMEAEWEPPTESEMAALNGVRIAA
jgi:predicted kinase